MEKECGRIGQDSVTSISLAEYKRLYAKPTQKRKKTRVGASKASEGEEILGLQLKALNIAFEREFRFCSTRRWRADFHLIGKMILVEVEGGVWSNGRHTRGKGYIADMEKYNTAQNLGYRVLRFETAQVKSGMAIRQIEEAVG